MAAVMGLPLQPDDEVLADLPEHDKAADPLLHAQILRSCGLPDGSCEDFAGEVVEIELGTATGDRLYRVRYSDGELQHLTAAEVRACMVPPAVEQPMAETGVPVGSGPGAIAGGGVQQTAAEEEAGLEATTAEEEEVVAAYLAEEEAIDIVISEEDQQPASVAAEEQEGALQELPTEADLIVLEDEEDVEEDLLEEAAPAPEKLGDEDGEVEDIIQGYLGGDGYENAEEEEEVVTPVVRSRALGVQREITKPATGRAKLNVIPKLARRPLLQEVDMSMGVVEDEEEAT